MVNRTFKMTCAALSLTLACACNIFSEDKMSAYMGATEEEYSRTYNSFAYTAPQQQAPVAQYGVYQGSYGGGYYPVGYVARVEEQSQQSSQW